MIPKRDAQGYAIDSYSNSPEDAAAFHAYFNGHLDDEPDWGPDGEPLAEEEDCWNDDEHCGCSDPCCPCDGNKVGVP